MKFYFFSPINAELIADGAPVGSANKNVLCYSAEKRTFFELVSSPDFEVCRAISSDQSFDCGFSRYPFYDGELLIAKFLQKARAEISFVSQTQLSVYGAEYRVNAYIDGFCRLCVEGYRDRVTVTLPITPKKIKAEKYGEYLIVEAVGRISHVCVFSTNPLRCLLSTTGDGVDVGETLTVTKLRRGVCDYILREHYALREEFPLLGKDLTAEKPLYKLKNKQLKALAFLETAGFCGDIAPFLDGKVRASADKITQFIGEFSYALPPLIEDYPETFSLIGKTLRYAKLSFEGENISDIDVRDQPF